MIRRRGIGTLIAIAMLVILFAIFVSTFYVINLSFQNLLQTSKERMHYSTEKRSENIRFENVYTGAGNILYLDIRNIGAVPVKILSIWINDTHISLEDRNIYIMPGEVKTIDTGYSIDPDKKYVIEIVSSRGKIYLTTYPFPTPIVGNITVVNWRDLPSAPHVFPSGSTATYASETFRNLGFNVSSYNSTIGSIAGGSLSSLYFDDNDYLIVDSTPVASTSTFYHATAYTLLVGSIVSGSISDVSAGDDSYLVISSSPVLSESILYAHSEGYNIGGTTYYTLMTLPANGSRSILSYTTTDTNWHKLGSFIYPLNGLSLSASTWAFYYRVNVTVISGGGGGGFSYLSAIEYTADNDRLEGWQYYRPIYINERTGSNLNNYQVKIVLTSDNFNFDHAKHDGSDIRFLDSDNSTLLNYWIEKWDYESKEAIVWVKVPSIPGGQTKVIYMYYGNPNATYDPDHYGLDKIIESLPASDGSNYRIYYQEWIMPESKFQSIGSAMGWHADDYQWRYRLPFNFPYYSSTYRYVAIASNGYIQVNGRSGHSDWSSTEGEFKRRKYICPYWADLMTNDDRNIYIKTDYSDEYGSGIYIRWYTFYYYYSGSQNFAVVLYRNGLIRFDYGYFSGSSSTDSSPVIGVSFGDNKHYTLSSYNGNRNPSHARSILFWPRKKASVEPEVVVGGESGGTPGLPGWKYYRPIYITERTGTTLTYYQVKIVLTPDNFDYSHVNSDGSDIRFLDSDNRTQLPYWIEKWDYGGTSIIWVKIPIIPGGSTKVIYMYYGNPDAESQSSLPSIITHLPASDGSNYKIIYSEWIMPENKFQNIGNAMGWHGDDSRWSYNLPFDFPFYSSTYKTIYICSNGFIGTTYTGTDYSSTDGELKARGMIAPFWADLMTTGSHNIYIKSDYSDEYGSGVYIRWYTTFYPGSGSQNFAVVLYGNGLIRFDYGSINGHSSTDSTQVVGISYGDRRHYVISSYDYGNLHGYPSNYNSIMFWPHKKATVDPEVSIGSEHAVGGGLIAVDINIIDSSGNIIQCIGSKVAQASIGANATWTTTIGRYNFPGYTSSEGQYLEIIYYVKALSNKTTYFQLDIDNPNLDLVNQTRVDLGLRELPSKYQFSIVFEGSSNLAKIWNNITYGLEAHYDFNGVVVNISVYNFNLSRYSEPGEEGYISYTYSNAPNDVYHSAVITTNPTYYRNESGYWRIKVAGYRDTVFNERFKAYIDFLNFTVSYVYKYAAIVNLRFENISLESIHRIDIISKIRYNSTGMILYHKVYNYSSGAWQYITEWNIVDTNENYYNSSITRNLASVVSNGILVLRFNTTLSSENAYPFREYIDLTYLRVVYRISGVFYIGRGGTNETYIYIPSKNNWSRIADAPFIWDGIARLLYTPSNKMIYAFNETHLFLYNTTTGEWRLLTQLPYQAGHGASIAYSNTYPDILIYIAGGDTQYAYKYNITVNTWTQIANIPEPVGEYGMAIGGDNASIYVAIGGGREGFYMYNITSDTWTQLANIPTVKLSGMTYYRGVMYVSDLGGGLFRYDTRLNKWSACSPKIPVTTSGEGERLLTDGTYLYYFRFDSTSELLRIKISNLRCT